MSIRKLTVKLCLKLFIPLLFILGIGFFLFGSAMTDIESYLSSFGWISGIFLLAIGCYLVSNGFEIYWFLKSKKELKAGKQIIDYTNPGAIILYNAIIMTVGICVVCGGNMIYHRMHTIEITNDNMQNTALTSFGSYYDISQEFTSEKNGTFYDTAHYKYLDYEEQVTLLSGNKMILFVTSFKSNNEMIAKSSFKNQFIPQLGTLSHSSLEGSQIITVTKKLTEQSGIENAYIIFEGGKFEFYCQQGGCYLSISAAANPEVLQKEQAELEKICLSFFCELRES